MNVRGIADEKHTTNAIAVRESCVHVVCRGPRNRLDANIFSPGAPGHHRSKTGSGEINVTFERNRRL
jgi:hypothetical protein